MQINVEAQPSPRIGRQTEAVVLDAEARISRQTYPASATDDLMLQRKMGSTSSADAEFASLWLAGFAAASVLLPSLAHWRSALRLGMGLFLFSMLQANFNGGGSTLSAGVYQWVVPAYFVSARGFCAISLEALSQTSSVFYFQKLCKE